jgi:hypothetical protein
MFTMISDIFKELIKYMVLESILLQDVMNSIYELSKASHRRSVCIISMSGSVSKVVLRTPNGSVSNDIMFWYLKWC